VGSSSKRDGDARGTSPRPPAAAAAVVTGADDGSLSDLGGEPGWKAYLPTGEDEAADEPHTVFEDRENVVFDERVGGRVYERAADGREADWADVIAREPPRRFVLRWRVNPKRAPTEIEVRFTAEDGRTRVDLEHRGWDEAGLAREEVGGTPRTNPRGTSCAAPRTGCRPSPDPVCRCSFGGVIRTRS
jgi:hypothetical protein